VPVLEVGSGGYNAALMAEIVGGRRLGLVGPTITARRLRRAPDTATRARLWAEAERLTGVTLPVPVA
jgi:protein-L-isoaspartate O-methyltransferase